MRSENWHKKALERKQIDNYRCAMCGRLESQSKGLQVHHIHYKTLGDENPYTDLVTLCGRCHILIHNYYKRQRDKASTAHIDIK